MGRQVNFLALAASGYSAEPVLGSATSFAKANIRIDDVGGGFSELGINLSLCIIYSTTDSLYTFWGSDW